MRTNIHVALIWSIITSTCAKCVDVNTLAHPSLRVSIVTTSTNDKSAVEPNYNLDTEGNGQSLRHSNMHKIKSLVTYLTARETSVGITMESNDNPNETMGKDEIVIDIDPTSKQYNTPKEVQAYEDDWLDGDNEAHASNRDNKLYPEQGISSNSGIQNYAQGWNEPGTFALDE